MNGVHDLGGKHGFGPVEREENEPYFHADWEKAVMVMNLIGMVKRIYNIDEFRHAIERMGQAEYLNTSYFEHWLASVSTLLVEKGVISREELEARTKEFEDNPQKPLPDRKDPELLERMMRVVRKGMAEQSEPDPAPRFHAGDMVVTRNWQPPGHTRLPGYARGITGGSMPSTASTSSPTRMPMVAAAAPSRSIPSASKRASCGARRRSRVSACTSICGRAI